MKKTNPFKDRVLITGASSGIGLHLAHVFARNGYNLALIAPVPSEIQEVARQIETEFGVDARAVPMDLTELDDNLDELADLADEVDILCNNAGLGMRGRFDQIPLEKHLQILRLNIEAVVRLTEFFVPRFLARGRGRVLNTASIAGFEPGPLMATYHASKAFVLSLTESLATEYENTGVTFTALCPGPVDTDFFDKAGMPESIAFQKGNLMAPQDVAETAYRAVISGERTVVPGAINKMNVAMSRVTPRSMQARMTAKQYEDAEEHKRDRGDKELPATVKRGH